jgi:hypothetical protein
VGELGELRGQLDDVAHMLGGLCDRPVVGPSQSLELIKAAHDLGVLVKRGERDGPDDGLHCLHAAEGFLRVPVGRLRGHLQTSELLAEDGERLLVSSLLFAKGFELFPEHADIIPRLVEALPKNFYLLHRRGGLHWWARRAGVGWRGARPPAAISVPRGTAGVATEAGVGASGEDGLAASGPGAGAGGGFGVGIGRDHGGLPVCGCPPV